MGRYTAEQFEQKFQDLTSVARMTIEFISAHVGGQPAGRDHVADFVIQHLGKTDASLWEHRNDPNTGEPILGRNGKPKKFLTKDGEAAVNRILEEEIRDEDATPAEGEIKERESYAVNVVRRSEFGPWIGDWMVKACFKQAFSRLGLFVSKKGSKGDVAEVGRVCAVPPSLLTSSCAMIHLVDAEGHPLGERQFERIHGRVHTAQGAQSIVTDCEVIQPGTRAHFEFRWFPGKLREEDVFAMLAVAGNCGLGSARSLERGKFKIVECIIEDKGPAKKEEKKGGRKKDVVKVDGDSDTIPVETSAAAD